MAYSTICTVVALLCSCGSCAGASSGSKCVLGDSCFPTPAQFRALGSSMEGDVFLEGDKGWKEAVTLKNKRLDGVIVPGAAVMTQTAHDVVLAMEFATKNNVELSVKSTGHCYNGNCMRKGSMHIDLSRMKTATVDKKSMEMHVQPGSNFAAMYDLADANGVLVVGGMCPTVGPVGCMLGGCHGPLIRSYGLGADNMLSVDIVMADAKLVRASADKNSDLFWALRGGGGGTLGVVVGMSVRLYPAPPQMVSLTCGWPLEKKGKTVGEPILAEWFKTVMPNLAEKWMTYTVVMKSALGPNVPFNYFSMNGLFVVEGLYNGPYSEALVSAKELLELGKEEQLKCSLTNFTSFKKWHDQAWFASEGPIPFRTYMAGTFAQPDFDSAAHAKLVADTVVALPANAVNMMFGVQLGGKVSKPASDSAISADFRSAQFFQENDADWNFEWADKTQIGWARAVGDAVKSQKGFSGTYMNECDPSKSRGEYEEAFWGNHTFSKLQDVKQKWDSGSVFNCEQGIYNRPPQLTVVV